MSGTNKTNFRRPVRAVHLGSKGAKAEYPVDFLRQHEARRLGVLVRPDDAAFLPWFDPCLLGRRRSLSR